MRFTDSLIDDLEEWNIDLYDGISTNGFWNHAGPWGPLSGGIDLDRNGVNDYEEHGEGWVDELWTEATMEFISRLWERIGSDNYMVINSGSFHGWWWDLHNGPLLEGGWPVRGQWDYFYYTYRSWMESAREPHLLVMDGKTSHELDEGPSDRDTYYQLMRFLLGTTLLGDGYFEFSDAIGASHDWVKYYDELDLDIGYPTTEAVELSDHVFVRFFTGGALILNARTTSSTVTDAELRALEGYAGPYWRFAGGQDPEHNDGSPFDSIILAGHSGRDENSRGVMVGDAIILVRAPITVVADIIIDDRRAGTSPGSSRAGLEGSWSGISGCWANVNSAWHVGPPWCDGDYGWNSYSTEAGDGTSSVEYRPMIGLAGTYEVAFFHGELDDSADGSAATDMPCSVEHVYGEDVLRIDLTENVGAWTSLGEFRFDVGTSGRVTCTNEANGRVIADAMRFSFIER